jgi:SAM-dependent methyltransferase
MADVYDDWYGAMADVGPIVDALAKLAGTGEALELGIGTGRLAVPLAGRGVVVHGVDSSAAMIERLAVASPAVAARTVVGDMAETLPDGPFALIYVAYNTLFGAASDAAQRSVFRRASAALAAGGSFVVEAFVPNVPAETTSGLDVRSIEVERVVLHAHRTDPSDQTVVGSYIDVTEAGGVRLRPYRIRWSTPAQLDAMAAEVGLELVSRHGGWTGEPFGDTSTAHVSRWRRVS